MDKAQERHGAAVKKSWDQAKRFIAGLPMEMSSADQAKAEVELFEKLMDNYLLGSADGTQNEQEWHKAIGGCPR